MSFPEPGWATISFLLIILSILSTILIFVWMKFCFYPGGRDRKSVIDMGELPKYNPDLQQQAGGEDDVEYDEAETQYTAQSGGHFNDQDQRPVKPALRQQSTEEYQRRGVQMMEI